MSVELELYGTKATLEKRGGRYVLRLGDAEYEANTVEELAVMAKDKVVELCGAKCKGAEDVVEAFLRSELKLAAEDLRDVWRASLVDRWGGKYEEVDVVRVEADKVWVYAHDYKRMIIKEYMLNIEDNKVSLRGKLVYCGPVVIKSPRGYYIFTEGRLTDVVEDLSVVQDVMIHRIGYVDSCYDADVGEEVATKIPTQKAQAVLVAARTPFYTYADGTIDWSAGKDLMAVLREGEAYSAARALKAREEVLRKYYGENYYPALATESLYIAASLIHVMKKASRTAVAHWVYVYGAAGLGKSVLAKNLVEMWCTTEECEEVYMPYVAGPLNENRLRNAVDLEGPAFVADEQDRDAVVKLLKMLGSATSDIIGVHAARYGKGFGAVFKVRRGILIITNVPASDAVSKVDAAIREAVKRRLLIVPWSAQKLDKDAARQLIQELRENTVGALKFVSAIYNKCDKLTEAADLLELAKAFWECASKIFNVDYSERLRALEWVETIQSEEKVQSDFGELEELWAAVKSYYRVSDDKEALLMLLNDSSVVEYTRDAGDRWNALFRRVCGRGVESNNPTEAFADIATCLYNIHIESMDAAEKLLRRIDVELLKKITELKAAGKYPWLKAPSWLIPHRRREVAGVVAVVDRHKGNIRRYDLFPDIFVRIFVESQEEEGLGESSAASLTNEQAELGNTGNTGNTSNSQQISSTLSEGHGERVEISSAGEETQNSQNSGVTGVTRVTQISPGQMTSTNKNEEEYSRCVKEAYKRYTEQGLPREKAIYQAIRECL